MMLGSIDLRTVMCKRFMVGIVGDSQGAGRANMAAAATGPDPAKDMTTAIATTFVASLEASIAQARADPPTYDIIKTATAVTTYVGTSGTTFAGAEIAIAQLLHKMGIRSVIAKYDIVGLALADMIAGSSYPTTPPRWYTTMETFMKNVESTYNARMALLLFSGSNNDGLNSSQSNAIPTNLTSFRSSFRASFPTAVFTQYKIHPDTVNFPGFNAGGTDTIANQQSGFAANPDIVKIVTDDYPAGGMGMSTDHAHLAGRGIYGLGSRAFYLGRRAAGWPEVRPGDQPILADTGSATADNGLASPCPDGSHVDGDIQLAFSVQMNASGTIAAPTTPTGGWTQAGTAASSVSAGNFTVRLVLWKRVVTTTLLNANNGIMPATTVTMDTGATANFALIGTFRGKVPGQAPTVVQVVNGTTTAGSTTTLSVPSITTGGADRTVIAIFSGFPSAASQAADSVSGITGFTDERPTAGLSSVVICPNTATCTFDLKTKKVPTASTISGLTATYSRTTISPVCMMIELSN